MLERMKLSEGWLSICLLFVMLISAALSISTAGWTQGLEHLMTVAVLALVAGLLLAKSRFPAPIAHLFSLVYGLFSVGYLIGRLVDQVTWYDRITELSRRASAWLKAATTGGTSHDSLMFVLLLSGLFWLLGHVAAWYTFRRLRIWRVLLPIGATLLVNQYVYTDPRVSAPSTASLVPFLAIFMLAALLYVVSTNIYMRESQWQSARVTYSTELRLDFVRAGVVLAAVALLVTFVAPGARAGPNLSTLWGGMEDMRSSVRETVTRLFASLDARGRTVANPFTNHMILGGPRNLGDEVLFDISAPGGRYWRGVTADRYTLGGWDNTVDERKVPLSPGQPINSDAFLMRREMTHTVTTYLVNGTQLIVAPEPKRIPQLATSASVYFEQGQVSSPSRLDSQKPLLPGTTYQVVSSVSEAPAESLRTASQTYPDWITRYYLQLPDTVTNRTRALAQEITAGHATVFDKAQAIEQYLRQNLRYDLNVPGPPTGQDFVDFVLFDLESGYCDYYATSFVVLARSVGIPARMAFGYAQSELDEDANVYRVRAKNGHSWPEVYFPEYGWIQFEPTVIIDPIAWPAPPPEPVADEDTAPGEDSSGSSENPRDDLSEFLQDQPGQPAGAALDSPSETSGGLSLIFLVLVGLLIFTGLGAAVTYWAVEGRGLRGLNFVERAYARMWRLAARIGVPNPPDQTPYERAEALLTLVPEGEAPIKSITELYVVERFGRGNGNGDGSGAGDGWSLLRPILWRAWLDRRFGRFWPWKKQRPVPDFYEIYQTKMEEMTKR
jgi:transglutaminase-like putative cysteine protease